MGISKVVKYNFNFLNYIIQFCLIFYFGPFHNSNQNKKQNKTTQTNKQKRQAFVVSIPKPKKPISNWFLKSGVPTIKPFLRQESGLFNSYKWMYIRQYGLSLFSLNVIAGISNVYIVSHHSKGMFINKKLIFSIIP